MKNYEPLGAAEQAVGGTLAPLGESYDSGGLDEALGRTPSVLAGILGGKGLTKLDELDAPNPEAGDRPSWGQSESDVEERLGQGYDPQRSFKDGQDVPYGTPGSVRPELYTNGESVEVKNYDVESSRGRSNLVRNVSDQIVKRVDNLPSGTAQKVVVDTRGQNVPVETLERIAERIAERTGGKVSPDDVAFIR